MLRMTDPVDPPAPSTPAEPGPARSAGTTAGTQPPGDRPLPGDLPLPGDRPPRRLLEQAPSERLAARRGGGEEGPGARVDADDGSPGRAVVYGLIAAAAGTLVHLVAATYLLWTGALLVVAVTMGILVGLAVAVGAGGAVRARARRTLALGLAMGAVGLAVGINWALSGMYLGPLDYLVQVYGMLVPLQLALAAAGAIAGSR